MSGFFPEDQHDYSIEAEEYRQQLREEYEFYQRNKKPDSIVETYKTMQNKIRELTVDTITLDDIINQKTL